MSTVVLSFLDWPLRRAFPACPALSKARPCKPGSHAYDEKIAAEVWDASAEFAGLPKAPQL
jgi:WW domain-containing oxidoreductase